MATIPLALPSCKSLDTTIATSATSTASATTHSHDTVILRDTFYRQDSVIYRERTFHDTVYITKEVYRDALNSKFKIQNSTKTDTIIKTDSIVQVIDHPPRKYIPPFYKHCTTILFIILAAGIAYFVCKIYIKFRL